MLLRMIYQMEKAFYDDHQIIPIDMAGARLDIALVACFPNYSRSALQRWLREEKILVNGHPASSKTKVMGGERVVLHMPEEADTSHCEPEAIDLNIVFEDEHLLVVNKPAGLVMHPAPGNRHGTVQNALLYYLPELAAIPRAGIVHRLDKDTTGLFVVAKTHLAHKSFVEQLQSRSMSRQYAAVVIGHMVAGGTVDQPIGRHPVDRKRMAVVSSGRPAMTHYRVQEKFSQHTYLRVKLETGRTHQIRVHMAHIRHPLVGDPVYGGRLKLPRGCSNVLQQTLQLFGRQALHALRLELEHPACHEQIAWESPLPKDFENLLNALRADEQAE